MPYTADPQDINTPLGSTELQYMDDELRAMKGYLNTVTAALGGPLPEWLLETKNKFINAAFNIWQRGTSTTVNNSYRADRWLGRCSLGTGTFTYSRDNGGYQAPYAVKLSHSALSSSDYLELEYSMEMLDSYDLIGQTVTISVYVKSTTNEGNLTCLVGYPSAVDNFTTVEYLTESSSTPVTSSWVRKEFVFTLSPSSPSSYTAANGLRVRFRYRPSTTGVKDVELSRPQLEVSAVATAHKSKGIREDLMDCMRYYQHYVRSTAAHGFDIRGYYGLSAPANYGGVNFLLPVVMRATPTATIEGTWAVTRATLDAITALSEYCIVIRLRGGSGTSGTSNSVISPPADGGFTLSAEF